MGYQGERSETEISSGGKKGGERIGKKTHRRKRKRNRDGGIVSRTVKKRKYEYRRIREERSNGSKFEFGAG